MTDKKDQPQSFLHEFQLEGRGSGKIALEDWEDSMDGVNKIITPEVLEEYKNTDWDNLPRVHMATYCHDCRKIVPPEFKRIRGKHRAVCGICRSKKISSGREEALKKFYHLFDKEDEEEKPQKDFSKKDSTGTRKK